MIERIIYERDVTAAGPLRAEPLRCSAGAFARRERETYEIARRCYNFGAEEAAREKSKRALLSVSIAGATTA